MGDCSSDGESVVTSTTVGSVGCPPPQLFEGLNMLHLNTQELENIIVDERCYSPMIPSQIVTGLSQLTEPLFSDMTDDDSTGSQSLLITDIAKHINHGELIHGGNNNLNQWIGQDVTQPSNIRQRDEEILSGQYQLPVFHDKPGFVGIEKSCPSVKAIKESLTDSDATQLENDDVSPTPNGKSCTHDASHLQDNSFPEAANVARDESDSAQADNSRDVNLSQMSKTFLSPDSEFTQPVKDETQLSIQNNLSKGLDKQDISNNRTAVFKKAAISGEVSDTKSSFVPPFKKLCLLANQRVQDITTSSTCTGQCTSKKNRVFNNSSSTVDVNKNVLSFSHCCTSVRSSSNSHPVGLCKVSQAVTSVPNDLEYSQVSTMSSRSLFSSSVPSESETSKPSDHMTDNVKEQPSGGGHIDSGGGHIDSGGGHIDSGGGHIDSGGGHIDSGGGHIDSGGGHIDSGGGHIDSGGSHIDSGGGHIDSGGGHIDSGGDHIDSGGGHIDSGRGHIDSGGCHIDSGVLGEHMCSSVSGTAFKGSMNVSHSSVENKKLDQFEQNHVKSCKISVYYDTEIGQISSDNKHNNVRLGDVNDPMLTRFSDSSSPLDISNNSTRSNINLTTDFKSTELKCSPFVTKHIESQNSCSSDQSSHYVKLSTELPVGSNMNIKSGLSGTAKSVCSTDRKKTLQTHTSSSRSSSITKSPSSKGSLASKRKSIKHSSQKKGMKSVERIISEANCESNFTPAYKRLHVDKYTTKAESEEPLKILRNQPQKLSISSNGTSVDLPDQSEKTLLIKMAAQYTEMAKMLENRHIDKKISESLAQRVKGLQMKILKISECHKHERANMMVRIQSGVLTKSEKLHLKSDMQGLAERQKLLVEIVKKHKDINTKLKSITVTAPSGSSSSVSEDKSNTSSGQAPSSSQASKGSIFDDSKMKAVSAENILGDGNKMSIDKGVMTSKYVSPGHEESVKCHKQVDCSGLKATSERITQDSSTSSDSVRLFSDFAKKSPVLFKKYIDLTDDAQGSTFEKLPMMSVSSSVRDNNQSRMCSYSTVNNNEEEKTVDNCKNHEKRQSKISATIPVKACRELPMKLSLNENSQKVLDDIFFTNRNEPCHFANTDVSNSLENNVNERLVMAVQKRKATCSGTEDNTGHKLTTGSIIHGNHVNVSTDNNGMHCETEVISKQLTGMTQGKQLSVNGADCKAKPEMQIDVVNNLANIIAGSHFNTNAVCNGKGCVSPAQQHCTGVHSTPTSNQSQAVQIKPSKVIILNAPKLPDKSCKRQIETHAETSVSVQLKRTKVVDKDGNILDVFVIQNSENLSTPLNSTAVEIDTNTDVFKSQKDSVKMKPSVLDAREVENAGEITEVSFANDTKSEMMLKTSMDLSSNKPVLEQKTNRIVSHNEEQSHCSKNCLPSQFVSPVCQNAPVFKSPQVVPTADASTTTSPCSTAVSSDVFPVSCTELARRMKAKALKQLQSCQTQNSNTVKTITVASAKKSAVPADPVNLAAKSPCLKDLVNAELVKPGHHVLRVNTKNGKVWGDVTNGGLIRGHQGTIFRTPCAWMAAISGCVAKKKAIVYQQIHYLNKPLSEYIKELIVTKKTKEEPISPVTRISPCPIDSKCVPVHQSRRVNYYPVKGKPSQPVSLSHGSNPVVATLLQTLHRCTVKLISDEEIVHCPDLTSAFWSSDFTKVNMSKNMWASVDRWT